MNIKAIILKLLCRRKNTGQIDPNQLKRILVVRLDKIGDTLCLLPMIRELKRAYPEAVIDVYAGIHNHFIFKHVHYVNHVYVKHRKRNPLKSLAEILRMRGNHYDLAIDTMEIKFQKVLSLLTIKPRWMIGSEGFVRRHGLTNKNLRLYDKLVPFKAEHMTDYLLSYLKPLGIDYKNTAMEFPLSKDSEQFAEKFFSIYSNKRLIGLNAEASDASRAISSENVLEICRKINALCDDAIILIFSSPDRREATAQIIRDSGISNIIPEEGSRNIFDAAALVSKLDVMISPDTSFVHIASAFDIPMVGIYHRDEEHIRLWHPRSKRHVVITPAQADGTTRGFSRDEVARAACSLATHSK